LRPLARKTAGGGYDPNDPNAPQPATVSSGSVYVVDGVTQTLEGEPPVASGGWRYVPYEQASP
jgi:hypothetical protein